MIRKKAVLQMDPAWIEPDSDGYVLSAILLDVGREILEIDVWQNRHLRYRHFIDREDETWASWDANIGKWSQAQLATLTSPYHFYLGSDATWQYPEDQKMVRRYLGCSPEYWEGGIGTRKYHTALQRKQDRIDALMAEIPPLPEDAEEWIGTKILPEQYLFLTKEDGRQRYFCTACEKAGFRTKHFVKIGPNTCPYCGAAVHAMYFRTGKERKMPVTFLQIIDGKRWAERICTARVCWNLEGKHIHIDSEINIVLDRGKTMGKVYYGQRYLSDEFEQEYWTSNPLNKRCGRKGYLYPVNLQETLIYGQLEHAGIKEAAARGIRADYNSWIMFGRQMPELQYLVTSGLIRLTGDLVEYGWHGYDPDWIGKDAHTAADLLKIDGNRRQRLKTIDGSSCALRWLQEEERSGWKIGTEELRYLDDVNVTPRDCERLLHLGISPNRIAHYLQKQPQSPGAAVITWTDYLRIAELEEMDVTDTIVRFPKKLKQRHDELVETRTKRQKSEEYSKLNKLIRKKLPETRRLFFKDKAFMIIPAGTCEELVEEGRQLHHCVGASTRYMEKMAEGRSWILFLRKQEALETPYYTLEIDLEDDRIVQWYSAFDRKPDEKEIKKELAKYAAHLARTRTQAAAAG